MAQLGLGPFGDSFTPSWANGDTKWGTLLNAKRHRCQENVGNTSENAFFDDVASGR